MRNLFFPFLFLGSLSLFSQQKFSKEFSFSNDNDLYVSFKKDRYYTNGMFLSYRVLAKDFGNLEKKIYEYQIGHQIYTPFKPIAVNIIGQDRPFAGYLYGSVGVQRVFKNQSLLKSNVQLGVVGDKAYGRELQNFIHRFYNFRSIDGWSQQIQNTLALNVDLEYVHSIGNIENTYNDISFVSRSRLGTIFNELTAGLYGRIGFLELQNLDNSITFHTNLNDDRTSKTRGIESFLFYEFTFTYVAYDATIQGSLFNDNSPITFTPNAVRFDLELGYKFTAGAWNFGYTYHFHSNKLPNLKRQNGNAYGRIFFTYQFN